MSRMTNRRSFLTQTALASAGLWAAGSAGCLPMRTHVRVRRVSPNEKLNVACIGAGGRAADDIRGVAGENIVALCDVDDERAARMFKNYPDARRFKDCRKMLDVMDKSIDAVVVAAPDHIHAPAAVRAMQMGKHVYCEKPLAHSIWECRLMAETAARCRVATQMGIQGHGMSGHRRAVELLRGGVLGPVREVHAWSDRPIWPQGIDRPTAVEPVPPTLDWDLWLGPAPRRPYNHIYVPFNWRGWWDFGTGALGDMGCHNMDVAFWGLNLGAPASVEALKVSDVHQETFPKSSMIRWEFPARGNRPPVSLTWYDGGLKPPRELADGLDLPTNGCLCIGTHGKLLSPDWHANDFKLLPEKEFRGLTGPPETIPRLPGDGEERHHAEWIRACKGGPPALADFAYSGPMTEAVILGNLAVRLGKKIEWDAPNMKARNCPEADVLIHPNIPTGWKM